MFVHALIQMLTLLLFDVYSGKFFTWTEMLELYGVAESCCPSNMSQSSEVQHAVAVGPWLVTYVMGRFVLCQSKHLTHIHTKQCPDRLPPRHYMPDIRQCDKSWPVWCWWSVLLQTNARDCFWWTLFQLCWARSLEQFTAPYSVGY